MFGALDAGDRTRVKRTSADKTGPLVGTDTRAGDVNGENQICTDSNGPRTLKRSAFRRLRYFRIMLKPIFMVNKNGHGTLTVWTASRNPNHSIPFWLFGSRARSETVYRWNIAVFRFPTRAINRRPGPDGRREVPSPGTSPAELAASYAGATDLRLPRRPRVRSINHSGRELSAPRIRAHVPATDAGSYWKTLITCADADTRVRRKCRLRVFL